MWLYDQLSLDQQISHDHFLPEIKPTLFKAEKNILKWNYLPLPPFWIMRIAQGWQGGIKWILMFEGVGYHNQ